jgi:hypothetical protein
VIVSEDPASIINGAAVLPGGAVLFDNFTFSAGVTSASFDAATGQLTLTDGDLAAPRTVTLAGIDANAAFQVAAIPETSDFTGTMVTVESIACYCPGTMIATVGGEIAVERLVIGDRVVTASGVALPIRWIGRRSYAGRFIAGNHLMLPVTVRAGALAHGVPHRDLVVSPGHAMFVDGQLVPVWRLVNGVTITQADAVEAVTYVHVELHRHDVLLANGAPAESFLDETGFRGQFQNAAEFAALYPDAAPLAPLQARLEDGFALQHIQARLAERAGLRPAVEPAGALRGYVDRASPDRVCGWAQDADSPEEPVALEITLSDVPVLTVLANAFRADLRRAALGSGCHAFDVPLPGGFDGPVAVRRVTDGAVLGWTDRADDCLLPGPGRSEQKFQLARLGQLECERRERPGLP